MTTAEVIAQLKHQTASDQAKWLANALKRWSA